MNCFSVLIRQRLTDTTEYNVLYTLADNAASQSLLLANSCLCCFARYLGTSCFVAF